MQNPNEVPRVITQLNRFLRCNMDHRVEEAIVLVEANLKGGVRVDWLARQLGISSSHLQHLFKNETGTTLLRYQQGIRIDRACELLERTHLSVKQIVSEVGAGDISHFIRDFSKAQGLSPRRYRLNFLSKK
jgi:AraC family transcriptional regulator of arabinose operon